MGEPASEDVGQASQPNAASQGSADSDIADAAVADIEQVAQPGAAPQAPAAAVLADAVMLEAVEADLEQQPPAQMQFAESVCERTRSRKRTADPESATQQAAAAAAVGGDVSAAPQRKRQRRTGPAATAVLGETSALHSDFAL